MVNENQPMKVDEMVDAVLDALVFGIAGEEPEPRDVSKDIKRYAFHYAPTWDIYEEVKWMVVYGLIYPVLPFEHIRPRNAYEAIDLWCRSHGRAAFVNFVQAVIEDRKID